MLVGAEDLAQGEGLGLGAQRIVRVMAQRIDDASNRLDCYQLQDKEQSVIAQAVEIVVEPVRGRLLTSELDVLRRYIIPELRFAGVQGPCARAGTVGCHHKHAATRNAYGI